MNGELEWQKQGLENNWISRNMGRQQPTQSLTASLAVPLFSDVQEQAREDIWLSCVTCVYSTIDTQYIDPVWAADTTFVPCLLPPTYKFCP